MQVQSLALLSGLRIRCCHEPWCRSAAVAPIQPLAWELPYAAGMALKSKTNKQKKNNKGQETAVRIFGQCGSGGSWVVVWHILPRLKIALVLK